MKSYHTLKELTNMKGLVEMNDETQLNKWLTLEET